MSEASKERQRCIDLIRQEEAGASVETRRTLKRIINRVNEVPQLGDAAVDKQGQAGESAQNLGWRSSEADKRHVIAKVIARETIAADHPAASMALSQLMMVLMSEKPHKYRIDEAPQRMSFVLKEDIIASLIYRTCNEINREIAELGNVT